MDESRRLIALLLVAAAMFFLRLDCALLEPEEARYAEIPREMLAAGEWVVPSYHGQPYFDKPPLLYWLVMGSYSLFGVHDWAARLAPGICGLLSVLAVYWWGCRVFNARTAFLGALALALMPRFIYLGRFLATDAPLSLGVLVALACAHCAIKGARRWWPAVGLACGWCLLAKGPVALILIAPPVFAYLCLDRSVKWPKAWDIAAMILAMLAIAPPWYAYMLNEPGFAEHFFWKHHVQRFLAPFDHQKPFWFYLPDLIAGTMPWCLALIPLAVMLYRIRAEIYNRTCPSVAFPLLASAWCLLFFSASGCKRVGYILPMLGPLALAIGWQIDRLLHRELLSKRRLVAATCVTGAVCLLAVLFALPWYNDRFSLRHQVIESTIQSTPSTAIACYPRDWDSIRFYTRRDDVHVFSATQRHELIEFVRQQPDAVVFLRDDQDAERLLADFAPLQTESVSRHGFHRAVRISGVEKSAALAVSGKSQ